MTQTTSYTNEQLVSMIRNGEDTDNAYEQLFINLRPVILGEAKMYQGKMTTYDYDDLIQEGHIVIWKTREPSRAGTSAPTSLPQSDATTSTFTAATR